MSETLLTRDGRTVLRLRRRLAHPPERVWPALVEPERLSAWFPARVELDGPGQALTAGARLRFVFEAGEGPTTTGQVTALEPAGPPMVVEFTWGDDRLRWEAHPDGDGTVLVLEHTFADRWGAASFAAGWHTCIGALGHVLAGREPAPGDPFTLHEAFVHALDLDVGWVEADGDAWVVRVERQLTAPVEAAWAALTGGGEPAPGDPPPAPATSEAVPALALVAVDPGRALEYGWGAPGAPEGTVRWALGDGTGHGARLHLAQRGRGDGAEAALAAWRLPVELLAAQALATRLRADRGD
jgi:uncharacterized protein YndB with AHSA1/START domain